MTGSDTLTTGNDDHCSVVGGVMSLIVGDKLLVQVHSVLARKLLKRVSIAPDKISEGMARSRQTNQ